MTLVTTEVNDLDTVVHLDCESNQTRLAETMVSAA